MHTIILCFAALLAVRTPARAPQTVSVSGRVVASEAIRMRTIRAALMPAAGGEAHTTIVSSDGSFDISYIAPGTYSLLAYSSLSVSTPQTISVGASGIANLTIALPEPKTIHGRISLQGNTIRNFPMPRLAFALAALPGISDSNATIPTNAQPDGSFQIALPQGERQISIVAGTITPGAKIQSFIYGTTDLLKNPVRVTPQNNAELRVVLDASAIMPFKVSGRVTDLLSTTGVRVVLVNPANLTLGSHETSVSPDGSFAFSNIIPGNYIARLSISGLTVGKQVVVADRDLTDVIITYPREFIVGGHIIIEGNTEATPSVTLEARNTRRGGDPRTAQSVNNVIMLRVKDGEHNVSLRSVPAGYQLKSITYGTTDLQKSPLRIDGPSTWEIIVRLTPAGR